MRDAEGAAPDERADKEVKQQTDWRTHADRRRHEAERLVQRGHHERRDEARNDAVADAIGYGHVTAHIMRARPAAARCSIPHGRKRSHP